MAADDALRRIQPLTHLRKGGGRYERDPAVEGEIESALDLASASLVARARNRDRTSPEFIREETLVYFIRAYHAAGQQAVVTQLTEALIARCTGWIFRRLRALGLRRQDAEDAYYRVIRTVVTAITDLASGRGDFYQVRFARALKLKVLTAYDTQLREVEYAGRQVRLNAAADATEDESDDGGIDRSALRDEALTVPTAEDEFLDREAQAERRALLDAVLRAIKNPNHREAFVLFKLEGWPITANNPADPCLTRHFNVKSAKTIYNWIKQAEADIAAAGFAAGQEEEQ